MRLLPQSSRYFTTIGDNCGAIKLKIRLRPVFLQMFPVKVPVGSAVLCDMEGKYKHLIKFIWRFLAASLKNPQNCGGGVNGELVLGSCDSGTLQTVLGVVLHK